MRCNWWMLELARAAAVLGALGLGSAAAFGQDDSDSDSSRERNRSSQEERSDDRSDRDDSERSNRDDSERSSRDDRQDSERSTQRDDRSRREGGQQGIPSERGERRDTERQSRSDREDRSSSSRDDRRSSSDREQGEEVGAEFEADDNDQLSVRNIEEGSLAARAGLRRHDRILTVDGRRFQDRRQLEDYLRRNMARRVPIIIDRDGERYTVVLPMRRMAGRIQAAQQSGPWLGVYLDDNEDGPVITHTYPQSPAQRAGLRPGDVVVQIDGQDVTDSEEVMRRIEDFHAHDQLKLTILRNDREREMTATLGDRSEIAFRQPGQGQGTFQGQGQFRDQGQGATWTEQPRYADTGRDARSYSRGSYSSGNEDAVQRLERMVQELRQEVRELRQQMDDR